VRKAAKNFPPSATAIWSISKRSESSFDFASETSMTYYNLDQNGQRVGQETVTIAVEPIRDGLFLVTWTESDKTTVVHLEDYRDNRIITNITDPTTGLSKFEGDMTEIA
jgi:hypothetical protein